MKPKYQARKNTVAGTTKRRRLATSSRNSVERSRRSQSAMSITPPMDRVLCHDLAYPCAKRANLPPEAGRPLGGPEDPSAACLAAALALLLARGGGARSLRRRAGRRRRRPAAPLG